MNNRLLNPTDWVQTLPAAHNLQMSRHLAAVAVAISVIIKILITHPKLYYKRSQMRLKQAAANYKEPHPKIVNSLTNES